MNKKDLVKRFAERRNLSNFKAENIVDDFLSILITTIRNGEDIEIRGFGCFRIRKQGPRPGRNPRTGEAAIIPSRYVVKFKKSSCWEIIGRY